MGLEYNSILVLRDVDTRCPLSLLHICVSYCAYFPYYIYAYDIVPTFPITYMRMILCLLSLLIILIIILLLYYLLLIIIYYIYACQFFCGDFVVVVVGCWQLIIDLRCELHHVDYWCARAISVYI